MGYRSSMSSNFQRLEWAGSEEGGWWSFGFEQHPVVQGPWTEDTWPWPEGDWILWSPLFPYCFKANLKLPVSPYHLGAPADEQIPHINSPSSTSPLLCWKQHQWEPISVLYIKHRTVAYHFSAPKKSPLIITINWVPTMCQALRICFV